MPALVTVKVTPRPRDPTPPPTEAVPAVPEKIALMGKILFWLAAGLLVLRLPRAFWRDVSRLFAGPGPANNAWRTPPMASTPTQAPVVQAPAPPAPAKAPRRVLKGVSIESANPAGLKTGGVWYDYGKCFKGEKPDPREAVGSVMDLQIVESRSDKRKKHGDSTWFVEAVLARSKPPAPAPAAAEDPKPQEAEAQAEILPVPADKAEPAAVPSAVEPPKAADAPSEQATEGQLKFARDLARNLRISDEDLDTLSRCRFQGRTLDQLTRQEMRKLMLPFLGGHALSN